MSYSFRAGVASCLALLLFSASVSTEAQPAFPGPPPPSGNEFLVYIGTYTGPKSQGIYVARLNAATGTLSEPELAAETINPSFLAIHPNHRFLYAVNEVGNFQDQPGGGVSAFAINPRSGRLSLLNQQSSRGGAPCHLSVDPTGQSVLVANYSGGNVAALPLDKNGHLGPAASVIQHEGSSVTQRQRRPHAHAINLDASNRFAVAADLGIDKLLVYKFDPAKSALTPHNPPSVSLEPGSGPRHFAFHPNARYAYVINELNCTVTAFTWNAERGELKPIQTLSTLPEGESVRKGFSTAEIQVHPSGNYLYGSNRGHNSIVAFAIDSATGKLTHLENQSTQGQTPRNFGIDPTGAYLIAANQASDNLVLFKINPETGRLNPTGRTIEVPTPVCVKFLPF